MRDKRTDIVDGTRMRDKRTDFCLNLEVVCGDVEPSEVVQRGDKTVQVDQHVVVQP